MLKKGGQKIILHFISGIKSGGVEQFLSNYSLYMIKNGFTVYIIYQHEAHPKSLARLEQAGCICIRVANKRKHPFKNIVDSIKIIKKIQPDIVECHQDLANFFPLIAARISGSKIRIVHIHSSNTDVKVPKLVLALMKMLIVKNATNRVACSATAGKFVYGNLSFKIVPNAINTNEFRFDKQIREQLRATLRLENKFVIGHVGRLTRAKNHVRLFQIFQKIREKNLNAELVLIGGGELEKNLIALAQEMQLSEHIAFLGEKNNVEDYYSLMDMMIMPSLYEGGPITAIEGQANGLPMILSTEVDPSVNILKTTKLYPLRSTDQQWALEVENLNKIFNNRYESNMVMENTHFNIEYGKKNLYQYYQSLLD